MTSFQVKMMTSSMSDVVVLKCKFFNYQNFPGYDNRCPPNRLPPIGIPGTCPTCPAERGCPIPDICCPTGCGTACVPVPRSKLSTIGVIV